MNRKKEAIYLVTIIVALLIGHWWGKGGEEKASSELSYVRCSPTELGYSCSMHPQLRITTPGDCPFCQMPLYREVVLPGAPTAGVVLTEAAAALANIQTSTVVAADQDTRMLRIVGKIAPDHNRIFTQVASLPGRIEKLYAQRPGQWISKGQPIARIYSKELISAVEAFRRPNTPESLRLSAQNNLREWQVSQKVFDALVATDNYRQAVDIYATASGLVQSLEAHVGEQAVNTIMGAPTTLYTLVDLSTVWVEMAVEETDIRYLRKGQEVEVKVEAFPEQTYWGKIISLAAEMNEPSRTLTALVSLPNPQLSLRPGMLARVIVKAKQAKLAETLLIPRSAVLWTGKRSVAFVKNNQGEIPVYELREVQIGHARGDDYELIAGLKEGEEIVTNGVFTLDAAAQLQGVPSMMNRKGKNL